MSDLELERVHLSTSRAALKAMRDRAEVLFTVGDKVAGDAYTAETLGRQMASISSYRFQSWSPFP